MATSQNGWRAGSRAELGITTFTVPGTGVRIPLLPGPSATVLLEVARRFDHEVEDIDTRDVRGYDLDDDWGYADRLIRGSETTVSNHGSGTAIDLNAVRHPLGRRGTFTRAQVAAIHRILADLDHVVRWGGDYSGRPDEMHFEINAGHAAVRRVADRLTTGTAGSRIPDLEDDMFDPDQHIDAIARAVLERLSVDPATGKPAPVIDLLKAAADPKRVWLHPIHGAVAQDWLFRGNQKAGLAAVAAERAANGDVDEAALAKALAPLIVPAVVEAVGGTTEDQVETALRRVLGSLDDQEVTP